MNSRAFLFFGRSGSGKGTQAKLLADVLKSAGKEVLYIETGSRFRALAGEDHLTGTLVKDLLEKGGLIPVYLPIWIWGSTLVQKYTGKEDLILDGLCRRKEESIALESAVDFYGIVKPNIVYINVSNDWSYTRMMERKRTDDSPEEIKTRLAWFEKDVMPAMEYFKDKEKFNFIEINGEQTVEEVNRDILKALSL